MKNILTKLRTIKLTMVLLMAAFILTACDDVAEYGSWPIDWEAFGKGGSSPEEHRYPDWMSKLGDETPLTDISIPGTHDSGANNNNEFVRTQAMDIDSQLWAGIRFLDMRFAMKDGELAVYHGDYYVNKTARDVFAQIRLFLNRFPSEAVIMRISREHPKKDEIGLFGEQIEKLFKENKDLVYPNEKNVKDITLGEMRGRVFPLMKNWGKPIRGWDYSGSNLKIKDDWAMWGIGSLWDKWISFKGGLQDAAKHNGDGNLYLTYGNGAMADGSGAIVLPYFVAAGTDSWNGALLPTGWLSMAGDGYYPDFFRGSCAGALCSIKYTGINFLTSHYLGDSQSSSMKAHTGILVFDFPGWSLINKIIKTNEIEWQGNPNRNLAIYQRSRDINEIGRNDVFVYKIKNVGKDKCIDAKSRNTGLSMKPCDDMPTSWEIPHYLSNEKPTLVKFKYGNGDLQCLDRAGTLGYNWVCHAEQNQKWIFTAKPSGTYIIRPQGRGDLCLEAEDSAVTIRRCNEEKNTQEWMLAKVGTEVEITNRSSQGNANVNAVCFYADVHYRGKETCYGKGYFSVSDAQNDTFSSVKADPYCSVTVFEQSWGGGERREYRYSTPNMGDFNDRASSLQVSCN